MNVDGQTLYLNIGTCTAGVEVMLKFIVTPNCARCEMIATARTPSGKTVFTKGRPNVFTFINDDAELIANVDGLVTIVDDTYVAEVNVALAKLRPVVLKLANVFVDFAGF